jgi:serine/threonine-protein kinase
MSNEHSGDASLSPSQFLWLDALCDRFEDAWQAARRPRIEQYLANTPEPRRSELLCELLLLDIEYRAKLGESPSAAEYKARFPHDGKLIDEAFLQAGRGEEPKARRGRAAGSGEPSEQRPIECDAKRAANDETSFEVVLEVIGGPHQGRRFRFTGHDSFIVGRASKAHFRLPQHDPYFSRLQFMVEVNPPCCRLMDLVSTNGTFVNERRVTVADLYHGDRIKGGDTVLQVSLFGPHGVVQPAQAQVSPRSDVDSTQAFPLEVPEAGREPPRGEAGGQTAPGAAQGHRPPVTPPVIPGYEIVRELGRGGMGVVYLAKRLALGDNVAVKTICPVYSAGDREVRRFLREAEILCTLRHPHIVAFHQMGRLGDLFYFVMDYVPGTDARHLLNAHGPFPVHRAVRVLCQVLDALDFAHRHGFVHRDVKPANLLVATSGDREVCRLADFGLARVYHDSRMSGLTVLGDLGGTLPYMPPEQITKFREASPPADQYSAAATLYHLLTGHYLYDFETDGDEQKLRKILSERELPVPIRQRRTDLPEPLARAVHRALEKDPSKRYPGVAALREALLPFSGIR